MFDCVCLARNGLLIGHLYARPGEDTGTTAPGMAKLRIELEKIIKVTYFRVERPDFDIDWVSISRLMNELADKRVIPIALLSSIRDVLSLANRAIHGESMKARDAESLAQLGVKVIAELRRIFRGLPGKSVEKRPISKQEEQQYSGAKYKVTTITPYQDEPYLSTYILDKREWMSSSRATMSMLSMWLELRFYWGKSTPTTLRSVAARYHWR